MVWPLRVQLVDDVPQREPALRVEARRGLVEEQHVGLVHDRPRDHQPLRHPARQLVDVGLGPVGEPELLEQLAGLAVCFLRAHAEVTTVEEEVLRRRRATGRACWSAAPRRSPAWPTAGCATTSMPPTHASPEVGITRVVSMPTVVVLPAPFGPSSPKTSPLCTERSSDSTTACTWPPRPSNTLVSATVRMTPSSPPGRGLGSGRLRCRSSCVPILRPRALRSQASTPGRSAVATGCCCRRR